MRRVYLFLLVVAALLVQLVVRDYLQDDQRMVEAFRVSKSDAVSSEIKVQGTYPKVLITEKDKESLLLYFAKGLGIESYSIDKSNVRLTCENEDAKTQIVIASQKKDTYVMTTVQLRDGKNLMAVKDRLSQLYEKLDMEPSCFICMMGTFPKKYEIGDMNEMKDLVFNHLECETKYAQKYAGGYEFYGYTPLLSQARKMRGETINVQLQFEYDAQNHRTIMNLAVPFFSQE